MVSGKLLLCCGFRENSCVVSSGETVVKTIVLWVFEYGCFVVAFAEVVALTGHRAI